MSDTLVTGATGFLGGVLARRLQADGERVRVLARPSSRAGTLRNCGFDVREGDLRDPGAVARAVDGCSKVFHAAALFRSDNVDDREFFDINAVGTLNVMQAAKAADVNRVVHVSTVGVHGNIEQPPADELAPIAPRDAYQQSKWEGESIARRVFAEGLSGTIIRPVGIYGPGDDRFLKLFRAVARRRFVMLGDGTSLYQMTYVDDVVQGLLLGASCAAGAGETFIIAGSPATTLKHLVELVARAVGVPAPRARLPIAPFELAAPWVQRFCRMMNVEPPLYPRRLEFFTDDRSFTTDKARELLGYKPSVGLDQGLAMTFDAYRKAGWL